ncbi:MAG TPA: hypothetical protein DEA26_04715 [Oceanospirillales bacterium]|nr:hypothetical protein [Oceanospirillaceae bacterium]HBS41960.1 hypothetical protein [Oceanospirillales bacterium]|tara:strand:+ start:1777 stop:1992 length:216 start_codon:yes stop_codon:yes gene_type:complete
MGLRRLLFVLIVVLSACGMQKSGLQLATDKELRKRNYECQMASSLSPAEIQVCQNIRRECDRRAGQGNYVC